MNNKLIMAALFLGTWLHGNILEGTEVPLDIALVTCPKWADGIASDDAGIIAYLNGMPQKARIGFRPCYIKKPSGDRAIVWVQEAELKWGQAAAISDLYINEGTAPDQSIAGKTWIEMVDFIKIINTKSGVTFRTPYLTEYAQLLEAREGRIALAERDNLDWGGAEPAASPCTSRQRDFHGLFDIVGNLWEYCWDEPSVEQISDMFGEGISHLPVRLLFGYAYDSDVREGELVQRAPFFIVENQGAPNVGFRLAIEHDVGKVNFSMADASLPIVADMIGRALNREIIVSEKIWEHRIGSIEIVASAETALRDIILNNSLEWTVDQTGRIILGGAE